MAHSYGRIRRSAISVPPFFFRKHAIIPVAPNMSSAVDGSGLLTYTLFDIEDEIGGDVPNI